jgi:hypothetical protein
MTTFTQPTAPRPSGRDLARGIDHTLLKPEATEAQIAQVCEEAQCYHFMAVCVNPIWVQRCAAALSGTATCVATVAGFPLGGTLTKVSIEAALLNDDEKENGVPAGLRSRGEMRQDVRRVFDRRRNGARCGFRAVSKLIYDILSRRHSRALQAGIQLSCWRRVFMRDLDARHVVPGTTCRRRAWRRRSGTLAPTACSAV